MSGTTHRPGREERDALGLPETIKFFTSVPFGGMNQTDARTSIGDHEFYWLENFIRVGNGNLRTLWDAGDALYTSPDGRTIIYFFWFNIGTANYCAVFHDDGTAVQVDVNGNVTNITTVVGTFYQAGASKPACQQTGAQYLLIANNFTQNGYWIWDGTVLYSAGTLSPIITLSSGGEGYSSPPNIFAYGGSGSGATFETIVANGSVVTVIPTGAGHGYLPGEIVQLQFSVGGSDTGAAIVAFLTPTPIGHISLLSAGSGYTDGTYALQVTTARGDTGSGGAATYTVTNGMVSAITLINPGSGYTLTPLVAFPYGGGVGAQGQVVLDATTVSSVDIFSGGSGYTGTPTLSFEGGGGSGATATVTVTSGVITSTSLTAAGSGYTSPPAVIIQAGQNNAAAGTVALMPYGVSGNAIENFVARVWLTYPNQQGKQQNGGSFLTSAPGSIVDFAPSDGGLIFTTSSRLLRAQYNNVRQLNGYLYFFGDSSVDVASNVQTSGSTTPITTLNYQNTDPQSGLVWRDAIADFGRTTVFANPNGVFALYGGAVTKISTKLNNLFASSVFPPNTGAATPSAAVADIYAVKVCFVLLTVIDPFTGNPRTVMVAYDEERKEWFIASQDVDLTFISTQEINSQMTAWGTDGSILAPLFQTPSEELTKIISTKLWGGNTDFLVKQSLALYLRAQDQTAAQSGVQATITIDSAGTAQQIGGPPQEAPSLNIPMPIQPNFQAPLGTYDVWGARTPDVPGTALGVTMISTSPDFLLSSLTLAYWDMASIFG